MHEKLPNLTITWMHKWSNYRWRSDNHEYFCTCIYITEFSKNLGMENCCRYHNFLCLQTQTLLFLEIATNSLLSLTFLAISCVSLAVPVSSVSLLSNSSAVIDCWSSSSYWLISFSHASSWFSTSSAQYSYNESFARQIFIIEVIFSIGMCWTTFSYKAIFCLARLLWSRNANAKWNSSKTSRGVRKKLNLAQCLLLSAFWLSQGKNMPIIVGLDHYQCN